MNLYETRLSMGRLFGTALPQEYFKDFGIIGIGYDQVRVADLTDITEEFLEGNFVPDEIEYCRGRRGLLLPRLAARLAAKEAVGKSLGGVDSWDFREVSVVRSQRGVPVLQLHGSARFRAENLGVEGFRLTLEHKRDYGAAACVALGRRGADNSVDTVIIS